MTKQKNKVDLIEKIQITEIGLDVLVFSMTVAIFLFNNLIIFGVIAFFATVFGHKLDGMYSKLRRELK